MTRALFLYPLHCLAEQKTAITFSLCLWNRTMFGVYAAVAIIIWMFDAVHKNS